MEIQDYTQIENIVKALDDELKPLFNEIAKVRGVVREMDKKQGQSPLTELLTRITKTSRRHDVENKIQTGGSKYKVGTNHLGIGYVSGWGTQLQPLADSKGRWWYGNGEQEQIIRDILNDKQAAIELTTILKKSNQKAFMEVVNVVQKHGIKTPFKTFKENTADSIKVEVEDVGVIKISRREIKVGEGVDAVEVDITKNDDGTISLPKDEEESEVLKKISSTRYSLNMEELKASCFITKHKEKLIKALKETQKTINKEIEIRDAELDELNKLLEPFLTLEKL